MKAVSLGLLGAVFLLSGCATTGSTAERNANAQAVADIDRMASSSLNGALTDTDTIAAERLKRSETWLRSELASVGEGATDADIAKAQQIVREADERGLPVIANDAERIEGRLIERRARDAEALVKQAKWLEALSLMSSLTSKSRPSSSGIASLRNTQSLVRAEINNAQGAAQPGAERFLFERMRSWVDASPAPAENEGAVNAVTGLATTLNFGNSSCPEAQNVPLTSFADGTKVIIDVELGSCEVRVSRASGVPRSSSYIVKVERMRQQEYTVTETHQTMVSDSRKDCRQVTKNIATTGPKNWITVSECNTTYFQVPVNQEVQVVKTRMVPVIEDETRTESYFAETSDASVNTPMSVTVSGDNQSVTVRDSAQARDHDEQYTRQHGASRSFRSDVELALKRGVAGPLQSLTSRAITEWNNRRAAARLAKARSAASLSEARALAVEAVALNPAVAKEAVPLLKLELDGPAFAALVRGAAAVPTRSLWSGRLELPAPSASLADEYARLEERKDQVEGTGNRDVLVGIGAGLQPAPNSKASGAFALELQIGYVPTFAAISHLIARIEGDLQIFAASFPQGDLAVRPEIGVRFGPFSLSVLAAGGGRIGLTQVDADTEVDGVFGARAYAGYGAHLALHLGPILLDAMALRLHQTANVAPIMTRLDGIFGIGLSDAVFLMARARYQAQADLLDAFKVSDRFASFILGIMLQF